MGDKIGDTLKKIEAIEKILNKGIVYRIFSRPFRYFTLHAIKYLSLKSSKKEILLEKQLIFGSKMFINLPSSADIYLFGCRTNKSDIVLCKFILNTSAEISSFYDIGANYGFYTLLMAVHSKASIFAAEPSGSAFELLEKNTKQCKTAIVKKVAIGSSSGLLEFHEFNTLYSEYNTREPDEYLMKSEWYKQNLPKVSKVEIMQIDNLALGFNDQKSLIKIDAENSEKEIIDGGLSFIKKYSPVVIMRYWNPNKRKNENQIKAIKTLCSLGYCIFLFDLNGEINEPLDKEIIDEEYPYEYILLKKSL